ncbi:tetratricopeptide repeat protein [Sorangium atrum]|uniref:Sel1 repeat family protein n=1 Tax=Sorangium atrum TaxID=2995308 RepID=A0ABT5BS32_9BACT|nr:sel1 repeat family protein [Sorangium aterium]MDC0676902.1 sel1 repeat family protein [Sorangium aterium]
MHVRELAPPLLGALFLCGCSSATAARRPAEPGRPAPEGRAATPRAAVSAEAAPPPLRLPCEADDLVGCTNGCADHQIEDCVTLGSMYLGGAIVSIDVERAMTLFEKACAEGSARGCLRLGDAYHDRLARADGAGGASGADEAALYWHARACHAGANLGCLAAGRAYLHGQGASADPGRAAALFQRVCERGNAHACVELGHLHAEGEGVQRDDRKAVELFTKACKLGLDEGCLRASRSGDVLPPRD